MTHGIEATRIDAAGNRDASKPCEVRPMQPWSVKVRRPCCRIRYVGRNEERLASAVSNELRRVSTRLLGYVRDDYLGAISRILAAVTRSILRRHRLRELPFP